MDFGVLCFDATQIVGNNDYQILLFNHEDGYTEGEVYAKNFLSLFTEFESNLNEWLENNRKNRGIGN